MTWVNYYIFTREDWATSSIQICSYYVHCPLPEQTSDAPPARKNKKWFDSRRRIGHRPAYVSWKASRRFSERRLAIEQIVFADEDHQNCQLGAFSEFETLVCRNSHGDIVPESQGGVWPERHPTVTSKNTQQARGLFAVSMPTRRAHQQKRR